MANAVTVHRCRQTCARPTDACDHCEAFQVTDYGSCIEVRGDAGRLFLRNPGSLRRLAEFAGAEAMGRGEG